MKKKKKEGGTLKKVLKLRAACICLVCFVRLAYLYHCAWYQQTRFISAAQILREKRQTVTGLQTVICTNVFEWTESKETEIERDIERLLKQSR
jgi:hypothetical protein